MASFLAPVPLCLELLLIGLGLLWFTRRQKAGKILVSAGAGLLLLLSYSFFPNLALRPLEWKYPPVANPAAGPGRPGEAGAGSYIVVLGGGIRSDKNLPVASQIGSSTLCRVLEGVRLYRAKPGRKLILSGGRLFSRLSEAQVMGRAALLMGVNPHDIIEESASRDTKDQARLLKPLLERERFFLVTSAFHMPRAMSLFRKQGLEPVPAPTDQQVSQMSKWAPPDFFPSSSALLKWELAEHEYLGLAWARLRGEI